MKIWQLGIEYPRFIQTDLKTNYHQQEELMQPIVREELED